MKHAVRRYLALAVASSLSLCFAAHAGTLTPGQSAVVGPADPTETWSVSGASLDIIAGGNVVYIAASNGARVGMTGADITTNSAYLIRGAQSQISLTNTTLVNTGGRALWMTGSPIGNGQAEITGSSLVGSGIGASTTGNDTLNLSRSRLEGLARDSSDLNSGSGLFIASNSQITASDGSEILGDAQGLYLRNSAQSDPSAGPARITLDGSRVEGRTGAGVVIAASRPDDVPITAEFTFRNGASLIGGNGNLLEVRAIDAQVGLVIDDSSLTGNILSIGGSTVDVSLANNASLLGTTQNITSMSLDNARWQLSGNSSTGSLSLGSGSEVALGDGSAFHTLNVSGNFTGADGTFLFNTVLAGDDAASDKLVIAGDTSGSANVRINNVGGAGAQTVNGIELITVGGASNGQFNLAGRAVGGQYEYFLHKGTGTDGNWYLRSVLPTAPDPCVVDPSLPECNPVLPGPDPDPVLRPEPGAYLANLQAAQTMFRLGYHDRHAGQNAGRAWARVDGSRNGFDAVSQQLDIRGNSQALTVGADLWRADTGSSLGVMLSTGNASSTSTNELTGYYARGKVKGEALGLYGTWHGGNGADPYAGFYVDGSVQRAQFRNRVEGIGLAGERYDSRAWQGAVETGYAFRLGSASNGGIYLEPQLQVGYSRWDDYRHTETNGTVVGTENADGLFGRAGLRLSGVTRWGNGAAEVQPYLAANWLHTRAESQISMDDEVVDARIPRSRGEFSAGASVKFGGGVGIWGGLSLQRASGYHQNAAQVGVSYSW